MITSHHNKDTRTMNGECANALWGSQQGLDKSMCTYIRQRSYVVRGFSSSPSSFFFRCTVQASQALFFFTFISRGAAMCKWTYAFKILRVYFGCVCLLFFSLLFSFTFYIYLITHIHEMKRRKVCFFIYIDINFYLSAVLKCFPSSVALATL